LQPLNNSSSITGLPEELLPSQGNELPRDEATQFVYGLIEVDPEIMEALEGGSDDEGFEELPDDFVKLANLEELPEDVEEWRGNNFEDEDSEEDYSNEDGDESKKQPKERLKYDKETLTEQRSILEERFEKVLEEYDENDSEEEEGEEGKEPTVMDPNLESILNEFLEENKKRIHHEDGVSDITRKMAQIDPLKSSDIEQEWEYLKIQQEPEFDVASMTSTYSNLYNHPKLIEEPQEKRIKLSVKTGIPIGVLPDKPKKQKPSRENLGTARTADETIEQKKERKKQIKEERREKRQNKKNLKIAFKTEHVNQLHIQANSSQPSLKL